MMRLCRIGIPFTETEKLIQLATYDTKRLTALKVLKPEAFKGVTVP